MATPQRFPGKLLPLLLIVALLAVVPPVAVALEDPFITRLFTRIVIFAIAAVALNFVLGFGGFASLLHAGFMGVGGYVVAILAYHDASDEPLTLGGIAFSGTSNLAISLPIAVLCCAALGVVTGLICLRTSGLYFIMITLALNQMIFYFFVALDRYGGENGLQILSNLTFAGLPIPRGSGYFYVCIGVLALALYLFTRVIGSRFGSVLRAMSQNEKRLVTLGIPILRYKVAAFTLSGTVTGLAGVLLACSQKFVSPADLSWVRSADLVVMVVLGGTATVWAPVIGAAAYFIAQLLLPEWTEHWLLPFGILVIITGTLLQRGLADFCAISLQRIFRAQRHG